MKSPHYKLQKAINNLKICLQLATRPDLTFEEKKFLTSFIKSLELSVALKEKRLAQYQILKAATDEVI